jgi:hypothetical protein
MERVSIVALLAISLGTCGCNCCRRTPAAAPVAVCTPAVQCDPCAPQGVTYGYGSSNYGGQGYGMPAATFYPPMQ